MQPTGVDDADITGWALAARAGDRAAAAAFIRTTQHQVHRFLGHLVDRHVVEELTQETYLRAMRALPRFTGRSSARTWLLAITRRVANDHSRPIRTSDRRRGFRSEILPYRTGILTPAESITAPAGRGHDGEADDTVLLRGLLDTLVRERREAFVATQVLGLSYAEAAEVCGCPVSAVRSRVAGARADLVTALTAQGDRTTAQGDRTTAS
ncbi:sigma-70 family RNA polymerase sigma factor [Micromonospora polyrhachis]|uniref:RNA polymerase sigma factor n=1 Tax=Micromonospora polyrhachis TaxID=1282883 RepID=A0A7W7SW23_9ACTN|nr:sigma-70 family RNA polymerase sigma factor [Micromonospora polyrhachis]MBB4962008.1 RNA polymerase sigma-70 factor (ECF subfamily) [Micromonospora polyrhachis]